MEIHIDDTKKLEDIKNEFSKKYPFLKIEFFKNAHAEGNGSPKSDMILEGVITNVTNFGAFVDIGVHQDGLIHISQLSDSFVRNTHEIVSVGDEVHVEVLKVEASLKRISLKRLK